MREVGAYEARTRLPELLKAVEGGETVTITRRGLPVARIVPIDGAREVDAAAVIARMKRARENRLGVTTEGILSARDEGRRG